VASTFSKSFLEDLQMEKPIAAGKSSFDLIQPDLLFRSLRLQAETILLDAACGAGNYSLAAAEYIGTGGAILAVDLWAEGIEQLQKTAAAKGLKQIKTMAADLGRRIPLADGEVDICLLATVLHDLKEVNSHEGALREISRVLRPEGQLAVIEFRKIEGPPGPPLRIRLSPEEVEQLLAPHRFRKIDQLDLGPYIYLAIYQLA
jgi:ubiquinone/menaquinone biosynthesis C-methylase UbiE